VPAQGLGEGKRDIGRPTGQLIPRGGKILNHVNAGGQEIGQKHDAAGSRGHAQLPAGHDRRLAQLQVSGLDVDELAAVAQDRAEVLQVRVRLRPAAAMRDQ